MSNDSGSRLYTVEERVGEAYKFLYSCVIAEKRNLISNRVYINSEGWYEKTKIKPLIAIMRLIKDLAAEAGLDINDELYQKLVQHDKGKGLKNGSKE